MHGFQQLASSTDAHGHNLSGVSVRYAQDWGRLWSKQCAAHLADRRWLNQSLPFSPTSRPLPSQMAGQADFYVLHLPLRKTM